MARKLVVRPEVVPERVRMTREFQVQCDQCGGPLDWADSTGELFPNVMELSLNAEECVSSRFRKDLCQECLGPIWDAVCAAFGVDSEDISGSSYQDGEENEFDEEEFG